MSTVTATVEFNQEKGTVKFVLDLQGTTELDHELLAAAIGTGRSVEIAPAHNGNELFAEFTVIDPNLWPKAIRALENRKRVSEGRPTIEEEEAQVAMRKASEEDAEVKAAQAREKAEATEEAKQEAADKRVADIAAAAAADTFKKMSKKDS